MNKTAYLLDTHALIFWNNKENVSREFIEYFDDIDQRGLLFVSSITFWEIALLNKNKRLKISNLFIWKSDIFDNTNLQLLNPSAKEMIDSTLLPDIHKDPFDRLLIAQAKHNNLQIVTKDKNIHKYKINTFWT